MREITNAVMIMMADPHFRRGVRRGAGLVLAVGILAGFVAGTLWGLVR